MWRLNKMLLKNQWTTHEIKKKKYIETNENKNMTTQNLWDESKIFLGWKLIDI